MKSKRNIKSIKEPRPPRVVVDLNSKEEYERIKAAAGIYKMGKFLRELVFESLDRRESARGWVPENRAV